MSLWRASRAIPRTASFERAPLDDARGRRVVRLASFDGGDGRGGDRAWRVEVGFPDLEMHDVAALRLERAGAREHFERRLRAEPPHAARERTHPASLVRKL